MASTAVPLKARALARLEPLAEPCASAKMRVIGLNVYYGDFHALKDVNLAIPERRVTAIMGPSGCGKSTLLRCLNRMIELVEGAKVYGRVYLDDVDIYSPRVDPTWVRKKVGMVFQKPNPLPMSIYDNVAYGPRIHGVRDGKTLDRIVERSLRLVGLWDEVKDRLREPAAKLSGGQQQRLCIARALAVEPEVLLLDEPTSSLDPRSTAKVEELIKSLSKHYTIVIVTHNVHQAMRVADYVALLYLGELVEYGPAEEVFNNPRHPITKSFVGGAIS